MDEDWKQHFHKSGIIVASSELGSHGEAYLTGSRNTQQILFEAGRQESGPVDLQSDESFEAALGLKTPRHGVTRPPLAYSNKASGWADSRGALDTMAQKCREAGVSFAAGQVNQLIIENGDVRGARLKEGEEYYADDLVILAAGSWSPAVFPELKDAVTATGQVLATIQLTAEEADEYSRTPVYIDMQTGFYSFPPNSDNVVKFAFHHRGYTNEQPSLADANTFVSTPRTGHFGGSLDEQIPKASVIALRQALAKVYPALAKKPFAGTRLCWYADSTDCDFIIDRHPRYQSLLLATGDSGHAFKFLPVMGDLMVQAIEGTLAPHLQHAWSHARPRKEKKEDRGDSVLLPLDLDSLAKGQDLLP